MLGNGMEGVRNMDLVLQTAQTIRDEKLLHTGDIVVVAVSGGPDSMALLHILHRLSTNEQYRLAVAHVNHQFRGLESDLEAVAVQQYAEGLGIPFHGIAIDIPAYIRQHGGNAQAVARELRYRYLHDIAEQLGAVAIALAHHADDQVETVLLNMLRGTSPRGLIGMLMRRTDKNMELIRPFLRIPKERLLRYCQSEQIIYYTDSSNSNRKYLRNRVRMDIVPQLLAINPRLPEAIDRMADIIREEDDYLNERTNDAAARILQFTGTSCKVSRRCWVAEPIALQRRLIKLILNHVVGGDYSSDFTKVESIRTAIDNDIQPSWSLQIDSFIRMVRDYDHIEWHSSHIDKQVPSCYAYEVASYGNELWIAEAQAMLNIQLELYSQDPSSIVEKLDLEQFEACFDAKQISFPLVIRSRLSGDRIELLGLNGSKKVKDMFIDLKISREWRDRVPLIVDQQGHILWIPGIGRSNIGLISCHTTQLLRMQLTLASTHQ
jgi:tRNA(Ile)-lysidine synthase